MPNCNFDAIEPASGERQTIAGKLGFVWNADLAPDEQPAPLHALTESGVPTRRVRAGPRDGSRAAARRRSFRDAGRPTASRIAFVSDRDGNGPCLFHACEGFANEVYVMDASGDDVRRLTTSPANDAAADWTGDGEWIVFGRIVDAEDDWDLWAVHADGECEVQLTDTKRSEIDAEWHGAGDGGLDC